MAAERPRRRITQPCLEYNGGLLHKEEIMLRKAMYASLNDSKKSSPSKLPDVNLTTSAQTLQNITSISQYSPDVAYSNGQVSSSEQYDNHSEPESNNGRNESATSTKASHSAFKTCPQNRKGMKLSKEPSKLLNYVIKKKKEKRNNSRTLLRTFSPTKFSENGEVSISSSVNAKTKTKKRKRRQRGALAVFVTMNKSVGGKISKNYFSEPEKEILLKNKKGRRRKRVALKNDICSRNNYSGNVESPLKRAKKDDKKSVRMVQAQRKFAKTHPLSPSSMRNQEESQFLSTSVTRAKTEDFITFLCLRNHPVLPRELEIFNHPCIAVSPLSDDQEGSNHSCPPSPTHSQSSISNVSNPSSTMHKSFSDSPDPSMDSPAAMDGPSWESGVVRMYADGPKGLTGNDKDQKKYEEPSDEADDSKESTKSLTPPLAFRISARPTNWTSSRAKDKQLPRPIPKPFAVMPTLAGSACSVPSSSALLHSMESSSSSPPPPPLLYIPAAAQRVTHLHGPPTLQRFPSTSPTREQESSELTDQRRRSVDHNAGPPPLKRFPPVVIEHERTKNSGGTEEGSYDELISSRDSIFRSILSRSPPIKSELKVGSSAFSKATSLSDLTKISPLTTDNEGTTSRWPSKEMPLLRRHSSSSHDAVCVEELVELCETPRSPPQLHRVPVSANENQVKPSIHLSETSANRSVTFCDRPANRQESIIRLESSDRQREKVGELVESSCPELRSLGNRVGSSGDINESDGSLQISTGRSKTAGCELQAFRGRLETSDSGYDAAYSRLSPNFLSIQSRLAKNDGWVPSKGPFIARTVHRDSSASSESSHVRASPLTVSTNRNSPQAFQVANYPVSNNPVANVSERGFSPGLLREIHKSTYVFSNRQTNLSSGNETGSLQVSSFIAPSKHIARRIPDLGESSSMHFQSLKGCSQPDEKQAFTEVIPHAANNQFTGHHSPSSFLFRSQQSLSELSGNVGDSFAAKRIPSPRSELFSRTSYEPINTTYMPQTGVVFPGSVSADAQTVALRTSTTGIRHKEASLDSFPPTWSRLKSPYSVPSVVSRISHPKPYTFSINLPDKLLSTRNCGSQSTGSLRNSGTPPLEGYSLAPVRSTDNQLVPVSQSANLDNAAKTGQLGRHVTQQENYRSFRLPSAFQVGDSRHGSRTRTVFRESPLSNIFSSERFVLDTEFNGCLSGNNSNRDSSSPLVRRADFTVKPPSSNSPNFNRQSSNPLLRENYPISTPPSSKSPELRVRKSCGPEAPVASVVSDIKKHLKSTSAITGKKASRNKQTVCTSAVFHPNEEEFKDPIAYIAKIRREAERFGVCVIVPPESWKPEFQISDNLRFNSDCQMIHRLQDRWGPVEDELACIKKHLDQQSISLVPMPQIGGYELDLPQFSKVMRQFGGLQKVIDNKKWTKVAETLKIPRAAQDRIGKLQDIYCKYLLSYDLLPQSEKADLLRHVQTEEKSKEHDPDSWSVKGRNFSLVPFQRLARNVQAHFFKTSPSANDVEREFWRYVHNRDSFVSVHRGTLDTNQEHSCFPTEKRDPYSKLGWNLNVLPHLPGSSLKHLGFVQDITIPWLHFEMLFSVKPWQVHPLALYTVEYHHSGAEKIWYCIPAGETKNLTSFLEQEGCKEVGTSLGDKMISPNSLAEGGVEVTRVVQKEGQFVVVFPEVYACSISCGYSISEAVSFAPSDWLLVGSKRYKELQDPALLKEFTYERLVVGLAEQLGDETQHVVQCLLEELKTVRDEEKSFMTELLEVGLVDTVDPDNCGAGSTGKKGKKSITSWTKADSSCVLYCDECDKPCYLSAITSNQEPRVLCLKHAIKHIRATGSTAGFRILSRYDTGRLDELVAEVEEKLRKMKDSIS